MQLPPHDTFEEINDLQCKITEILKKSKNKEINLDSRLIQSYKDLEKICADVLQNREHSKYFKRVSPYDVKMGPSSQGRAITIDPDHKASLKESVKKTGGPQVAMLLTEDSKSTGSYIISNGCHRDEVTKELITAGDLPEECTYPAVAIPAVERANVQYAIDEAQGILNSGFPKKLANTNSVGKDITNYVKNYNVDLEDEESYNNVVNYFNIKYSHVAESTIKSNVTRVKNKLVVSDVFCATPEEFIKKFTDVFKINKPENKSEYWKVGKRVCTTKDYGKQCQLRFISNKGSSIDQAVWRDIKFRNDNLEKKIAHILGCQDNKGDMQTTIKTRKAYFEHMYRMYRLLEGIADHLLPIPDFVAIVPQNLQPFEVELAVGEAKLMTKKEIPTLKSSWIIVTREELLAYYESEEFSSVRPYKPEWLLREQPIELELVVNQ